MASAPRARARILALTQCLPYPPHTGVTNRIFHVLTGLQARFDVLLVPFVRRFHHPAPPDIEAARLELGRRLTWIADPVAIPGERSAARRLLNHFGSLVTGRPFVKFEYSAPAFGKQIALARTRGAPAMMHAESLDLYDWFQNLPDAPLTVTHHSIESDLLRIRASVSAGSVLPAYLRLQARRFEALERDWAPRVTTNLMMSTLEAERLRQLAPKAATLVVPNGVDLSYFTPGLSPRAASPRLVFAGPTYVYQNREGIDWFLEAVWPRLRQRNPAVQLDLLGGTRAEDAARYAAIEGVQVHGHVPDVRPFLQAAWASIVPLRVGGGTRLKILDSWAMETPVVSTAVGCEGLEAEDGGNLLIRNTADEFGAAVSGLLADAGLRGRIGQAGRATAERSYRWEVIVARLADYYETLIG